MQHSRLLSSLVPAVSLIALLAVAPANAVPCGAYAAVGGIKTGSTDLGTSAATCRNGGVGDANDSLADLNGGTYFSSANWALLTRSEDNKTGDAAFWAFSSSTKPNGTISGTFSLKAGLWNLYSKLVVVLKDGGSTTNKDIKWSAYLLPASVYGPYTWSYDNRKQLSHATIYGVVGGRTSVPEPATLALLGFGLAAAGLALRRQLSR